MKSLHCVDTGMTQLGHGNGARKLRVAATRLKRSSVRRLGPSAYLLVLLSFFVLSIGRAQGPVADAELKRRNLPWNIIKGLHKDGTDRAAPVTATSSGNYGTRPLPRAAEFESSQEGAEKKTLLLHGMKVLGSTARMQSGKRRRSNLGGTIAGQIEGLLHGPSNRVHHAMVSVGRVLYLFGGETLLNDQTEYLHDMWKFEISSTACNQGRWTNLNPSGVTEQLKRSHHVLLALPNAGVSGQIILLGGNGGEFVSSGSCCTEIRDFTVWVA